MNHEDYQKIVDRFTNEKETCILIVKNAEGTHHYGNRMGKDDPVDFLIVLKKIIKQLWHCLKHSKKGEKP